MFALFYPMPPKRSSLWGQRSSRRIATTLSASQGTKVAVVMTQVLQIILLSYSNYNDTFPSIRAILSLTCSTSTTAAVILVAIHKLTESHQKPFIYSARISWVFSTVGSTSAHNLCFEECSYPPTTSMHSRSFWFLYLLHSNLSSQPVTAGSMSSWINFAFGEVIRNLQYILLCCIFKLNFTIKRSSELYLIAS